MGRVWLWAVIIVLMAVAQGCVFALQVGVYTPSIGAGGVLEALAGRQGISVVKLESLDLPKLVGCDVLVLESMKGLGGGNEKWRDSIRTFAAAGGGVVLEHDAVGFRGWDDQTRLFPEIVALGIDRSTTRQMQVVADHPVTADLPAEFEHAYNDHIMMQVGPEGATIINDADGVAATIVGEYGEGRVVGNGMISGYGIDESGAAKQMAATGAQLQLLLNAIQWAGGNELSALPAGEVLARMAAAIERELAAKAPEPPPYTDWYPQTAMQEAGYQKQPLAELDGRAWQWWTLKPGYTNEMIHRHVRQMRRNGVTDIIYLGQSGLQLGYHSEIPEAKRKSWVGRYKERDPLKLVCEAAKAEGLRVWLGMHSGDYGEGMVCVDHKGKPYMYGSHPIDDVRSPQLYAFLTKVLTEVKQKYDLAGFYYDELFFNYPDKCGSHFEDFSRWCEQQFGAKPDQSLLGKMEAGVPWHDPADVWWRRLMLYKAKNNAEFMKFLADTAHSLGMEAIGELRPCAQYANGATYAMDNPALVRAGCDWYYTSSHNAAEATVVYPNAAGGQHHGGPFGYYNTYNLRGKPTFNFVFYHIEHPIAWGSPEHPERLRAMLRDTREWHGADSLARAALLTYQYGIMLQLIDPRPVEKMEQNLLLRLGRYQDVDRLEAEDTRYYENYRVLLAPPYSLQGQSAETFAALEKFVSDGGTVLSLGGPWMQSLRDLSKPLELTAKFVGGNCEGEPRAVDSIKMDADTEIKIAPQDLKPFIATAEIEVLASFGDGKPAVTSHSIGKGKVIGFHCDVLGEIAAGGRELEAYLARLMSEASVPEIKILAGEAEIKTSLQKNNWVAVSLYDPEMPAKVKVSLDIERLGVKANGYRVLLYGRSRELLKPTGVYHPEPWTADDLKEGLELEIPPAGTSHWDLPEDLGLSVWPEWDQNWLGTQVPKMWAGHRGLRECGFELLVVCPDDELTISGEKTVVGR